MKIGGRRKGHRAHYAAQREPALRVRGYVDANLLGSIEATAKASCWRIMYDKPPRRAVFAIVQPKAAQ